MPDGAEGTEEFDGLEHGVEIVGRFAHAHEEDPGHRPEAARQGHLGDDLGAADLAPEPVATCHAEGTAHGAADLGGDAEPAPRKQHALQGLAVGQFDQEARRPIRPGILASQAGETAQVGRQGRKRPAQPQGEKVLGTAMARIDGDGPRPGQQEALFMGGLGPVAAQALTQMLDPQRLSRGPGASWAPIRCH